MKKTLLQLALALSVAVFSAGCDKKAQVADISASVNAKLDSVKGVKPGLQDFGGMGFAISDPAATGGNWVISTSAQNNTAEADVSKYIKDNDKYIFLLHAYEGMSGKGEFGGGVETIPMLAGFAAAFVTGCLACKFMIEIVKRGKLIWFAAYCAVVGIVATVCHFIA